MVPSSSPQYDLLYKPDTELFKYSTFTYELFYSECWQVKGKVPGNTSLADKD